MPIIYVDSKYRTPDSLSPTDFSIELRDNLTVESDAVMRLDQVRIPLSCYTVNDNNQFLYLSESPDDSSVQPRVLTLTQQAYSGVELAAEIQKQLNSGGPFIQNRRAGYNCTYDQGALTILKLPSSRAPVISEANQNLYVLGWDRVSLSNVKFSVQLTPGSYSTALLLQELFAKLNEHPYNWTVEYLEATGRIRVTSSLDFCFVPDNQLATIDLTEYGTTEPKSANAIFGVQNFQLNNVWTSDAPLNLPDDPETFTLWTDAQLRGNNLFRRESYQPQPIFTEASRYLYGLFYDAVSDLVQFPKFEMPLNLRGNAAEIAAEVEEAMRNTPVPVFNVSTNYHVVAAADDRLVAMYGDSTGQKQITFLTDDVLTALAGFAKVDRGVNDLLYLQCVWDTQTANYLLTLAPGYYTAGMLALHLENLLNATTTIFHTVLVPRPFLVTVSFGVITVRLSGPVSQRFTFLTDTFLNSVPLSVLKSTFSQNITAVNSANNFIGHTAAESPHTTVWTAGRSIVEPAFPPKMLSLGVELSQVTRRNNKLYLECRNSGVGSYTKIVIPPGVYPIETFRATLTRLLNQASTIFNTAENPNPWSVRVAGNFLQVSLAGVESNRNWAFTFWPDSQFAVEARRGFDFNLFQLQDPGTPETCNGVLGNTGSYSAIAGSGFWSAASAFQGPKAPTPVWWCQQLSSLQEKWDYYSPGTSPSNPKSCNRQLGNADFSMNGQLWRSASPLMIPQTTYVDTRVWELGDRINPRSFNKNLHHPDATTQDGKTFKSQWVSLLPDNIYVNSDLLNATSSHGPRQESTIAFKMPVTEGYGYVLFGDSPTYMWHKVGPMSRRRLSFRVTDEHGLPLDLNGLCVSWVLHLDDMP